MKKWLDKYQSKGEVKNSLNRKVTCSNCGWSWKLSDGGEDPLTCHKCGGTIKMKHGGELDEYQTKGEVKQSFRDQLLERNGPIVDASAAPIVLPPNLRYDKTRVVNGPSAGLTKTQLKNVYQHLKKEAEQEKIQELVDYKAAKLFHENNPVAKVLGTRKPKPTTVKPTTRELAYGFGAGINNFYDLPDIGIANDFINPLSLVSKGIISPWAQAPLQAQQSDSYLPYLGAAVSTALTAPMVRPATMAIPKTGEVIGQELRYLIDELNPLFKRGKETFLNTKDLPLGKRLTNAFNSGTLGIKRLKDNSFHNWYNMTPEQVALAMKEEMNNLPKGSYITDKNMSANSAPIYWTRVAKNPKEYTFIRTGNKQPLNFTGYKGKRITNALPKNYEDVPEIKELIANYEKDLEILKKFAPRDAIQRKKDELNQLIFNKLQEVSFINPKAKQLMYDFHNNYKPILDNPIIEANKNTGLNFPLTEVREKYFGIPEFAQPTIYSVKGNPLTDRFLPYMKNYTKGRIEQNLNNLNNSFINFKTVPVINSNDVDQLDELSFKQGGLVKYQRGEEVKFNPYENVNRVSSSDGTRVFRLNPEQVENAKKAAAIRNEKIVKEYQQNQRSFIGPDKRTKAEIAKGIALKKEYDRVKAMQNSDLAKTFASFTPGNNIEAGVMGAETFANLNPIISGPILATSRLAPAILHPTNNAYWGSDRSNLENTLGALEAIGDISMINPLTKGLTNYIGGSKAFKYAKSYAQHPLLKPITNTFNNRLESIENIKNKLPKFLDPQHHINAQKSLNEANQWMNNWYNHPAILERIDNIKKAKSKNLLFSFEEDALLKRIKDKNYVNEFESNLNKIYDFIGGRKRVHKNNYGTSGYGLDLFADQSKRQNLVSKYIDPSKITVTGIHEGTHGLTDGNNLINSYKNMLQKPFDLTDYNPRSIDGTYKRYDDYLLDPPEIYSQINEIRYENNIKPDEIVTPEKVDEIIKKGRSGNSNVIFSFYDLIKDKDNFRNLLNYLPAVIPAAAGVGALQEKKHGGIIEDDMGQWAHPGQVTRINSNKITMQGVPYPVTGVDNLGNTMVMQPGMNYTFPGQYVTEYPMMQKGGLVKYKNKGEVKKAESVVNKIDPETYTKNQYERSKDFHTKWMTSPMYNKMLNASDLINAKKINKIRFDNLNNTRFVYEPIQPEDKVNTGGDSDIEGVVNIYPRGYNDNVSLLGTHEMSHSIDRPSVLFSGSEPDRVIPYEDVYRIDDYANVNRYNPKSLEDELYHKEFLDRYDYIATPTETRARLNEIRDSANQNKIYDPFTQKVNKKIFKKLTNFKFEKNPNWNPMDDLKSVYTDKQIINLLNTVSKNNKVFLNPQIMDNNSDWEIIG